MRALKLALSISGLSLLTLLAATSGPSQAQGPTFKLEVCNQYRLPVAFALAHLTAPNERRFVARGWGALEKSGDCAAIEIPRAPFATLGIAIADNKIDKAWIGGQNNSQRICITFEAFERVLTENYRCDESKGEFLADFQVWRAPNTGDFKVIFK